MFISAKKSFNLLFLLLLVHQTFAQNYRQVFGEPYLRAERSAAKLRSLLQQYAQTYHEDAQLMEAIIFPELMRYSAMYDVIETGSLISLYSRFGSEYADFSIGLLQMKPSFAVTIETELATRKNEPWVTQLGFNNLLLTDNYDARIARVHRLENSEWQVKYLLAMLKCIAQKHHTQKLSSTQRLLFAASAYNCGWNKSAKVINAYISKKFYKLSKWPGADTYKFADVALYRYNELKAVPAENNGGLVR